MKAHQQFDFDNKLITVRQLGQRSIIPVMNADWDSIVRGNQGIRSG